MTDENSGAPRKKRRATEYTKHRAQIGIGLEFATRSVKRRDGSYTSIHDQRLAIHYKAAFEGDVGSIKVMIRAIKDNLKAAQKQGFAHRTAEESKQQEKWEARLDSFDARKEVKPEPVNADLAMFILGIAGVGDPMLESLGVPGSPTYLEGLKTLGPTRFEPWFLEEMLARATSMRLPASDIQAICNRMARSTSNFSEWHASRERLLADMMRVRGPGATRFVPGQSGNRRGRPPKQNIQLPFDGFLMKMVEIPIQGKMRKVSRLDALIYKLASMDPRKRPGVGAQITELLMRLHTSGWEPAFEYPQIIEV